MIRARKLKSVGMRAKVTSRHTCPFMVLMFYLCLTGAFDSATVENQLLYLLLWLLPELVLVYGLGH